MSRATRNGANPGRLRGLIARIAGSRAARPAGADLPPLSRRAQALAMLAFFALGALIAWLLAADPLGLGLTGGGPAAAAAPPSAEAATLFQCPMHPEVLEDMAGDCPICGMPLVEVESGAARRAGDGQRRGVVRIDPVQVQNIGVVSVAARRADIARTSRAVGILDYDAQLTTRVNTKYEGWIEGVRVEYVGQSVERGEPLFEIYSPALVTTQDEYLRALEYAASLAAGGDSHALGQAERLVRSTRERLAHWDVGEEQIRELESTGEVRRKIIVRSPARGLVVEVMNESLEGMYVRPGMDLYRIADLSRVWVHADIFESDIPWMRPGLDATISVTGDSGESQRGRVLFLYPEVSRDSRTLRVCLEVPNPKLSLRPGMYANVTIEGPAERDAVVVPTSAVIRSGTRDVVFVALGEGRFEPRTVALGLRGQGDDQQVLSGVQPGERVVTEAQFMIDSESRMQEAIAKFRERGTTTGRPAHEH